MGRTDTWGEIQDILLCSLHCNLPFASLLKKTWVKVYITFQKIKKKKKWMWETVSSEESSPPFALKTISPWATPELGALAFWIVCKLQRAEVKKMFPLHHQLLEQCLAQTSVQREIYKLHLNHSEVRIGPWTLSLSMGKKRSDFKVWTGTELKQILTVSNVFSINKGKNTSK